MPRNQYLQEMFDQEVIGTEKVKEVNGGESLEVGAEFNDRRSPRRSSRSGTSSLIALLLESTLQVPGKDLIVFYYSSDSWRIASYLLELSF
jgi:hypothetical protein